MNLTSYDLRCAVQKTLAHALDYLGDSPAGNIVEDALFALRNEYHEDPANAGVPFPLNPICYSYTQKMHPDFCRNLPRSAY